MKAIVIGSGVISSAHIEAYRKKGIEIASIVDPVREAREKAAETWGIPHTAATLEEALAYHPDVASLCTPNYLHAPHAVALLEAGVDVISEKPMARTVRECDAMIEAAERTGKRLFVAHSQRLYPPHQHLIDVMRAGTLGKPVMVISTFIGDEYRRMNDPANWKGDFEHSGGGVLIDNGSHMINMLLGAFGPVESVESIGTRALIQPEHKAEDTSVVNLKFRNGTVASLTVTFVARACSFPKGYCGCAIRTEVVAEKGFVTAGNGTPAFQIVDNEGNTLERYEKENEVPAPRPNVLAHILDCIRDGSEPFVTMYDARETVRVIEAAYRSAREGVRVSL